MKAEERLETKWAEAQTALARIVQPWLEDIARQARREALEDALAVVTSSCGCADDIRALMEGEDG